MTGKDDTFGPTVGGAGEPTRIVKPTPGGRPPSGRGRPPPEPSLPPRTDCVGISPLEVAASPLLDVLARLGSAKGHSDLQRLHGVLTQEVQRFETKARTTKVTGEDIWVARYALCTALDDAVLNAPWAGDSGWAQQPLLFLFHKEKKGGVRFFEILNKLLQNPRENLQVLQLMYVCLVLGYQGRYRNEPRGEGELRAWRKRLFQEIRQEHARELSPNWKGSPRKPTTTPRQYALQWAMVAAVGLIVATVYSALAVRIHQASNPVYESLLAIKAPIARSKTKPPEKTAPQLPDQKRLRQFLANDIASGAVRLFESELDSRVVLAVSESGGLFQSGRADVKPAYRPLLERIGEALRALSGKILVIGHTDNIPPKRGFPSNYDLSLARANSIEKMLRALVGSTERFLPAEGRGASEPLVPNNTRANRALNRRAEIRLLHYADN